jgi:hypothetical protein
VHGGGQVTARLLAVEAAQVDVEAEGPQSGQGDGHRLDELARNDGFERKG